jgi:hypothetical protein
MSQDESEKPYQRKLSTAGRFARLLISPTKAMEDIGNAPDYGGVVIIIILEAVLAIMSLALVFTKLQIIGPEAPEIMSYVNGILAIAVVIAVGIFVVQWLVKSLLVMAGCNSGSSWRFSTAASVTAYAYLADIIVGIIGLIASWYLIPPLVIDTSNMTQAMANISQYQAQATLLKLTFTLPVSIIGVIWKSYLGGLGAHFGTKKMCSRGTGITVFLILGFIGLAIDFLL